MELVLILRVYLSLCSPGAFNAVNGGANGLSILKTAAGSFPITTNQAVWAEVMGTFLLVYVLSQSQASEGHYHRLFDRRVFYRELSHASCLSHCVPCPSQPRGALLHGHPPHHRAPPHDRPHPLRHRYAPHRSIHADNGHRPPPYSAPLSSLPCLTFLPCLLVSGFVVLLDHIALIPITGCSINPARSFGSAVIANKWDDHWVFWVGPMVSSIQYLTK